MNMLKNERTCPNYLLNGGCSCCNTKAERRKIKKSAKAREKRAWKKEVTSA